MVLMDHGDGVLSHVQSGFNWARGTAALCPRSHALALPAAAGHTGLLYPVEAVVETRNKDFN